MTRGRIALAGGRVLVSDALKAENALERARGLLGRKMLRPDQALMIEPCGFIHTIGMRYDLDIAFLDAEGVVIKIARALAPLRIAGALGAHSTVEMVSGGLARIGIEPGMKLSWQPGRNQSAA